MCLRVMFYTNVLLQYFLIKGTLISERQCLTLSDTTSQWSDSSAKYDCLKGLNT